MTQFEEESLDLYPEEEEIVTVSKRHDYKVCPECRGEGKVVHRAVSVWTSEDRAEDPDGFEDMMRGMYDVPCPECNGLHVVDQEVEEEFKDKEDAHFEMLREQGIYPGNPDYF